MLTHAKFGAAFQLLMGICFGFINVVPVKKYDNPDYAFYLVIIIVMDAMWTTNVVITFMMACTDICTLTAVHQRASNLHYLLILCIYNLVTGMIVYLPLATNLDAIGRSILYVVVIGFFLIFIIGHYHRFKKIQGRKGILTTGSEQGSDREDLLDAQIAISYAEELVN